MYTFNDKLNMKGFIYKVTNKVTGKSYIGLTRYTVEFRWRLHQHKKDKAYFHNAIRKYGVENFTVETLEECDYKDLDSREIYYIAKYDTFNNGYNLTLGGGGNKILTLDEKYDEIKSLYLSGFSSNKIATLYKVDKSTIVKILKSLGIKLRSNKLNINNLELQELILDYQTGYSLAELAKRYNCSGPGLKEFLEHKGVDVNIKYTILKDEKKLLELIKDYTTDTIELSEILRKYHCSYATLLKVLSMHGIKKGKYKFKLKEKECLEAIDMANRKISVQDIAHHFKVDKCTIYSLLKRYNINYSTI